jgi:DNA-binding LacI/PurR family transcriptional regulator
MSATSVTIRDVARQAGVGVGTVSRVLNDNPFVSESTRERVMLAIQELDYRPSPIARRLSLGKSLTIAVIAPFITRPSVVERLRGIEYGLSLSGYDLVLYNVETPLRRNTCFVDVPRRARVDGLILISLPPSDEDVHRFYHSGVPAVLVDAPHPALNRVVIDDVEGGRKAVCYLLDLGHRRIGFIGDTLDNPFHFVSSRYRLQGYHQALTEAGLPLVPEYQAQADHGREPAREAARWMLDLPEPPTAIFVASDTQAIGVLELARDVGLHIPRDLSVMGYDDLEVAEYLRLTTINQPLFATGLMGVELLMEAIEQPQMDCRQITLPTELVVRGTTGPAAV